MDGTRPTPGRPPAPRVPPPPDRRLRLSDAAIDDIAEEIARAFPLPPPDDRSTWILSDAAELSDEDEERVIRALARRRADGPRHRPA